MYIPVAKPDPDHLLLHVEAVGHIRDLLRGGLGVLTKGPLQGNADRGLDGGALFPPPAHAVGGREGVAVDARVVKRVVRIFQPLLQEWFQLAHVLE